MSDERDCFERWDDGVSRIIQKELAGEPVPEAWRLRERALHAECVAAELAAKAAAGPGEGARQGALFDGGRRYV